MDTKRPAVVTIAAILLVVLALFVAGLGFASQYGLLGRGFGNRAFATGQFRNRTFNPQDGFPSGNGNPVGTLPNGQANPGNTPNFSRTFAGGTGLARIFRLIRPITLGLDIALLILAGIAAFGLFTGHRWGAILAIVIAVLLILLTIPSMIRIFSAIILVENLVRILLAIAVIVLLLLPSARRTYSAVQANNQEGAERIVR